MADNPDVKTSGAGTILALTTSPQVWLWFAVLVAAALLCLPISVPIGPLYWDTYLYLDAAQRIGLGQLPNVDFSTPVGPLGYYLFAWGLDLFDQAQPLLLAEWSQLAVTAPLMALVLPDLAKKGRALAFAILVPFLVFALIPANAQFFHTYPGLDGFGIYNRQTSVLLYVLATGLVFMPDGRRLAVFCGLVMLALFSTKITGFLVGGLIGLIALLAGRLALRTLLLAAAVFLLPLVALELFTGIVWAYLADIASLVAINDDGLLPRFLTVASLKADVILPAGLLVLALIWAERLPGASRVAIFDRSSVWFAAALFGGIVFETQNTGSQEFIFVWPILLMAFARLASVTGPTRTLCLVLAAFVTIPTVSEVVHKGLRAVAVAPTYVTPQDPLLKNMRQVSTRPDIMQRAMLLEGHYAAHAAAYADLADRGELPSWQLYNELDYQMHWVLSAGTAVEALLALEKDRSIRFSSLMTLDFVNPFPWLLDRDTPRAIQIGADPTRTMTPLTPEEKAAVEATDGVLVPKCPPTKDRRALEQHYRPALAGRQVVPLGPCWDILVRPGLLKSP